MMRKLFQLLGLSSVLTAFLLQPAFASIIRSIDGEGSDAYFDTGNHLHDNNFVYPLDTKGSPTCPWISPTDAYQGLGAIGLRYPANSTNSNNTQKVGYQLTFPDGPGGVGFGQDQYTGFALKLGSGTVGKDFNFPTDWVLLAQYHQGSPHSPPLSLQIQPNSNQNNTVKYAIYAINDQTAYANPANGALWSGTRMEYTTKIFEGKLTRGKYYRFVLKTNFQPTSSATKGLVSLWVNGVPVKVFGKTFTQYDGYVGYNPTSQPEGIALPASSLGFWIDIYRAMQPSLSQTVYFDNVTVGTSYNEVDPAQTQARTLVKSKFSPKKRFINKNTKKRKLPVVRKQSAVCGG